MIFEQMIDLENNGFFSATWLVQNRDRVWGLWPDVEGNRSYDDGEEFVVWIGNAYHTKDFLYQAMLAAIARYRVEWYHLLIEPNDGSETAIQVQYKDTPITVTGEGARLVGLKCGADQGNFAVIWSPGVSFTKMHLALIGGEDLVEQWANDHEKFGPYSKGIPGEYWYSDYELYRNLGDHPSWTFRIPGCQGDHPRCCGELGECKCGRHFCGNGYCKECNDG
ncbi:MAG: hypothetical protein GY832_44495 [Chloroflexi bacterium]|nr:hypothetical protein [Chloroflexota bacterium]